MPRMLPHIVQTSLFLDKEKSLSVQRSPESDKAKKQRTSWLIARAIEKAGLSLTRLVKFLVCYN